MCRYPTYVTLGLSRHLRSRNTNSILGVLRLLLLWAFDVVPQKPNAIQVRAAHEV